MMDVQELLQGNDSIIYMGSQLIISCSGIPDAQTPFKKKKTQQFVLQFPSYHRYRLGHVPFSGELPMVNSLKELFS